MKANSILDIKLKYFYLFTIILINSTQILCSEFNSNKFVIGTLGNGFFGNFICVLNHLIWCEKNNKIPVVYWDKQCIYYQPQGYNGSSNNVWKYYFEQVSNLDYIPGDNINTSFLALDRTTLPIIQFDIHLFKQWLETFKPVNKIINKYVQIKEPIINKINKFYKEKMKSKKTIGIHFRGTDKKLEIPQINPFILIAEANKYKDCQYLVATDEVKFLELAKKHLNGKVIFYDAYRSNDGSPIHHNFKVNALRGEEVLIEAQLLSKCDTIIHGCSNVTVCCYYFNPELKGILFRYNDRFLINF